LRFNARFAEGLQRKALKMRGECIPSALTTPSPRRLR
jgi:hypothetical protein